MQLPPDPDFSLLPDNVLEALHGILLAHGSYRGSIAGTRDAACFRSTCSGWRSAATLPSSVDLVRRLQWLVALPMHACMSSPCMHERMHELMHELGENQQGSVLCCV